MTVHTASRHTVDAGPGRQVALVDLLDRLLGTGVVLTGDITVSLAGVDLVHIKLHALIASIRSEWEEQWR